MADASTATGSWVWDPAGSDHELAQACVDLRAGRWSAADAVLRASLGDPGLRASRSLVLGAVAAGSRTAETWVREYPDSAEARLVFARVAAARALRANSADADSTQALAHAAVEACHAALEPRGAVDDATPFVIELSIAHLLDRPSPGERRVPGRPGAWPLWEEIRRRDPVGREAHYRMLHYLSADGAGSHSQMWDFALWAAAQATPGSPGLLMPLAARAEHYKAYSAEKLAFQQWFSPDAKRQLTDAYSEWFPAVRGMRFVPVPDLSLLAYGMHECFGGTPATRQVLAAMMPYAHRWPWSIDGDPAQRLDWAAIRCGLKPP